MHTHTQRHDFSKPCVIMFFCSHIDELSQGLLFCDDGHHIKSSRKAWICSNAAWGRGRHTDTPLPQILDDVWGVRYHLCTGATVDIWWYLEFGMSLSEFFLSENHGRIFLALINLWFSSQRPEPQWISARNDDAVDMTSPMIGSVLGWTFPQKCFAMQKIDRIPLEGHLRSPNARCLSRKTERKRRPKLELPSDGDGSWWITIQGLVLGHNFFPWDFRSHSNMFGNPKNSWKTSSKNIIGLEIGLGIAMVTGDLPSSKNQQILGW